MDSRTVAGQTSNQKPDDGETRPSRQARTTRQHTRTNQDRPKAAMNQDNRRFVNVRNGRSGNLP
jgi:uncharacterized protein YcbX